MPSRAGEARLRGGGLVLPSIENVAILKRKKGGKCANTHRPVWGTSPGFVQSKFFAPVREPPPTGATALEVHKMNRHSRKNGGKPSCQHVPEEVSHGVSSFREAAPRWQRICEREERQDSFNSPAHAGLFLYFFQNFCSHIPHIPHVPHIPRLAHFFVLCVAHYEHYLDT